MSTHWLLTEYLKNENLADDLFRMFFHIDDNTTLPAEYVESLKKEYTGVYYDRFIRGDWVVANGAIYKVFSDNPSAYDVGITRSPISRILIISISGWISAGTARSMLLLRVE